MALFAQAQQKRIEDKVQQVESRTAGEVVVASVPRAAEYAGQRLLYSVGLGLLCAALAHRFTPGLDHDSVLLLQLPFAAAAWFLLGLPALLRPLIPPELRQRAVQQRAERMFTEHAVFHTRDRSGVLILLSELEQRVVILGDHGIHARVQADGWQRHVDHIVKAIRGGRAADGVCEVLDELGTVLAEVFPPRPDDENELPNTVIER